MNTGRLIGTIYCGASRFKLSSVEHVRMHSSGCKNPQGHPRHFYKCPNCTFLFSFRNDEPACIKDQRSCCLFLKLSRVCCWHGRILGTRVCVTFLRPFFSFFSSFLLNSLSFRYQGKLKTIESRLFLPYSIGSRQKRP